MSTNPEPLRIPEPPVAELQVNIDRLRQSSNSVHENLHLLGEGSPGAPRVALHHEGRGGIHVGPVFAVLKAAGKFKSLLHRAHFTNALAALNSTPPFTHLKNKEKQDLAALMHERRFKDGEVIVHGGVHQDAIILLAEGGAVGNAALDGGRTSYWFSPPAVFGEYEVIFEAPRKNTLTAIGETVCFALPKKVYEELLKNTSFSHALRRDLRKNKKLFWNITSFINFTSNAMSSGVLNFQEILERYHQFVPAIHSKMNSRDIDTAGWLYAIRRLPENITTTYAFLVTTVVPPMFLQASLLSQKILTAGRRRMIFQLHAGKNLVLIREDYSDILDFVTCMCLHSIEAEKCRHRITAPASADLILEFTQKHPNPSAQEQDALLAKLPFTPEEREGLKAIWPKDLIQRLWEILVHHENFTLCLDLPPNYAIDSLEKWSEEIRVCATKMMGDLDDLEVEIISSNTHSVVNCLSSYIHKNTEKILQWGKEHYAEAFLPNWYNKTDQLYAVSAAYFRAFPQASKDCEASNIADGIITLQQTELTGIQVNLIDLSRVNPNHTDPHLAFNGKLRRRLLVNIDYAFGKQAEDILTCLVLLFGPNIRSVNVLGKAGAFQGSRGDVIIARHLVMQDSEEIVHLGNEGLAESYVKQLSGRNVWSGGVLTVKGTLLQDRDLLLYYKKLWGCVSLEMEGSYYARVVQKFRESNFLRSDVATRFLYYVSDLPLAPESTLALKLGLDEGVPPLYATTRAFLKQIFLWADTAVVNELQLNVA